MGVDILAGLLGGDPAGFLRSPGDVSHHFLAYRIDAFTDPAAFRAEMDRLLRGLRETPPAPGQADCHGGERNSLDAGTRQFR